MRAEDQNAETRFREMPELALVGFFGQKSIFKAK
jgi:hypothetical protein